MSSIESNDNNKNSNEEQTNLSQEKKPHCSPSRTISGTTITFDSNLWSPSDFTLIYSFLHPELLKENDF